MKNKHTIYVMKPGRVYKVEVEETVGHEIIETHQFETRQEAFEKAEELKLKYDGAIIAEMSY